MIKNITSFINIIKQTWRRPVGEGNGEDNGENNDEKNGENTDFAPP